jgi:hypothetical protein
MPALAPDVAPKAPVPQAREGNQLNSKDWAMKNVKVVGWILFGLIIAGPKPPMLYPQDSRLARLEDGKSKNETVLSQAPKGSASHEKVVQPDIILPDIYISIPSRGAKPPEVLKPAQQDHSSTDSTALKQKLQKAEIKLRHLQNERQHLLKTLEQLKMRPLKGASRSTGPTTELLGRPSV